MLSGTYTVVATSSLSKIKINAKLSPGIQEKDLLQRTDLPTGHWPQTHRPKLRKSLNLSWTQNADKALTVSFCSFFPFCEMELEQFSKVRLDKDCSVQMCTDEIIQHRLTAVIATKGPYQFSHQIQIVEYFGSSVYATALLCITLSVAAHFQLLAVREQLLLFILITCKP